MIIDGKIVGELIKSEVRNDVMELHSRGIYPKLAVVIVGERPDSIKYVKNKEIACEELKVISEIIRLSKSISQKELIEVIEKLNNDVTVHAIMVQSPLPNHINEDEIVNAILPIKDVDCFHPVNVGRMVIGNPYTMPCTPFGVLRLLDHYNIQIEGKKAVVLGRSNIVGKPMSLMLMQRNATVSTIHTKTPDKLIKRELEEADIIVSAIGQANWLSEKIYTPQKQQVLIDVGINFVEGKMVGDIDKKFKENSYAYSPVPGGTGKTTVAILLQNCIKCCKEQNKQLH